jgi:hypothetical protein
MSSTFDESLQEILYEAGLSIEINGPISTSIKNAIDKHIIGPNEAEYPTEVQRNNKSVGDYVREEQRTKLWSTQND